MISKDAPSLITRTSIHASRWR